MKNTFSLFPFLFCLCLLSLSKPAFSQDIIFDWKYIISNGNSLAGRSIVTDSSGYVYVAGTVTDTLTFIDSTINCPENSVAFLAKLDSTGDLIWFKQFKWSREITSLCIDHENNLYATGTYVYYVNLGDTILYSNNTQTNVSNQYIVKFTTHGQLLWAKSTSGIWYIAGNGGMPLNKITVDNNNDVIITGRCIDSIQYFDTTATLNFQTPETGFLAKYSSSGQKLWVKKIGGANCYPYAVKTDNANNIVITGMFDDIAIFDTINIYPNGWDIFLTKYTNNGSLIWISRAGGSSDNYAYDIGIDTLNNIYFTGQVNGSNVDFDSTIYYTNASDKGFIAKYSSTGNIIWLLPLNKAEGFSIQTYHNKIYLIGTFNDVLSFGNVTLTCIGSRDIFLLKMDLDGNVEKAAQYIEQNGSLYPNNLALDKSGNIYITGIYQSSTFIYDILIAKIPYNIPVSSDLIEFLPNIRLYPNPCIDEINIVIKENSSSFYQIEIFDLSGKRLLIVTEPDLLYKVNVSTFPKGYYFLKISNKFYTKSEKFVKL